MNVNDLQSWESVRVNETRRVRLSDDRGSPVRGGGDFRFRAADFGVHVGAPDFL